MEFSSPQDVSFEKKRELRILRTSYSGVQTNSLLFRLDLSMHEHCFKFFGILRPEDLKLEPAFVRELFNSESLGR